jgi:hypothetical protein
LWADIFGRRHACRAYLGEKGRTPIVEATGARHGMSQMSAITSKGHMRFMIKDNGGVNAAAFIEFLKRLITGGVIVGERGRRAKTPTTRINAPAASPPAVLH